MTAQAAQTLLLIHGVGGAPREDHWRPILSDTIAQQGHSRPEQSSVRLVTADYRAALLSPGDVKMPKETWRRPKDSTSDESAYQERRHEVARVVSAYRGIPPMLHAGMAPKQPAQLLARLIELAGKELRNEAHRYRSDEKARASVLEKVLEVVPTQGRLVIVAHSLGSVVALDLIKRLPQAVTVDMLLTAGSPLWHDMFRTRADVIDPFPYDRLKSWVNIFDSRDFVPAGRGIGVRFRNAVDVDMHFGSAVAYLKNHALDYYLSLPVTAALVGDALYGGPVQVAGQDSLPSHGIGTFWDAHLLTAAYAQQVSITCDGKKLQWRRRFDAARRSTVLKLLSVAEQRRATLPATAIAFPSEADLLDHAVGLTQRTRSDEELLTFTITMLMSSPVAPFDLGVAPEHAEQALTALFDRVRQDGSPLADHLFAQRVAEALKDARSVMQAGSMTWAYFLVGGAAILAATGVGLIAAAPAGLAGAALLTSTLASFGPGGMVGGILTIAAASSAGSALLGTGVAVATREQVRESQRVVSALAELPKEALRATLIALITQIIAEDKLSFQSSANEIRALLTAALVAITNEENAHRGLHSEGAEEWTERREVVELALKWLAKTHADPMHRLVERALSRSSGDLEVDPALLVDEVDPPSLSKELPATEQT